MPKININVPAVANKERSLFQTALNSAKELPNRISTSSVAKSKIVKVVGVGTGLTVATAYGIGISAKQLRGAAQNLNLISPSAYEQSEENLKTLKNQIEYAKNYGNAIRDFTLFGKTSPDYYTGLNQLNQNRLGNYGGYSGTQEPQTQVQQKNVLVSLAVPAVLLTGFGLLTYFAVVQIGNMKRSVKQ